MSATEAVIQFIGIIMLTASVPNDPGVHAIAPRIEGVASGTSTQRIGRISSPIDPDPVQAVEPHIAVILYQKSDRLGTPTWTPATYQTSWEYVVLNGERLHFVTSAANGAPSIPRDLPHACPTMTLQTSFQAPNYAGAAAVIDLEEGFLDTCRAQPPSGNSGRADTRLYLKTNGSFVIVATKPNEPARTITFTPNATVYIANIPPKYLEIASPLLTIDTLPHHHAYDMMGATSNCTTTPDTSAICQMCDPSPAKKDPSAANKETSPANKKQYPFPLMTNSECSNTQWP